MLAAIWGNTWEECPEDCAPAGARLAAMGAADFEMPFLAWLPPASLEPSAADRIPDEGQQPFLSWSSAPFVKKVCCSVGSGSVLVHLALTLGAPLSDTLSSMLAEWGGAVTADCAGVLEPVPSETLAAGAALCSAPRRVLEGMTSLRLVSMPTCETTTKVITFHCRWYSKGWCIPFGFFMKLLGSWPWFVPEEQ